MIDDLSIDLVIVIIGFIAPTVCSSHRSFDRCAYESTLIR
jgi:hypothetical protein